LIATGLKNTGTPKNQEEEIGVQNMTVVAVSQDMSGEAAHMTTSMLADMKTTTIMTRQPTPTFLHAVPNTPAEAVLISHQEIKR
jgi:hypothetical protein